MGGEALLDEALRLWTRYAEIVHPAAVTRLALRYLNRLDLPFKDGDEFQKFLVAVPSCRTALPKK